ncbi:MAG: D-amino acid dehydrogenase [Woeseiaceae bacterium]
MRVVVLGAGVVGVATAHFLAKKGYEVVVVDRAESVASGASFANGGQLSYSFTDALARPGMPAKLPSLVFGADAAIRVRPPLDIEFLRWGMSFLGQCSASKFHDNTVAVLRLALQSGTLIRELVADVDIDFSYRAAGKLVLLRSASEMDAATKSVALKTASGCDVRLLSFDEACDIEPSLVSMRSGYSGAVYSPGDEVGDAALFSKGLAAYLKRERGVEFRLGCHVNGLQVKNERIAGVTCDGGEMPADAVVVCLGASSAGFLRKTGLRVPIVPLRGYSVTLPEGAKAPRVSISDTEHRVVFSAMNGMVRIAGFADFVGFDESGDARRTQQLLEVAKRIAPDAADYSSPDPQPWGGFRPMTANSRPIVGPTNTRGLYLNCGHGMLGWTLACATGFNVAQQIEKF